MKAVFLDASYSEEIQKPGVSFSVRDFTWQAMGGPGQATIEASGEPTDLWEVIELLRRPVEIYSDTGKAVWWGYVRSVQVTTEHIQFEVSVDSMANRVRVIYSQINEAGTTGERAETTWVTDTDSSTAYGTKEGQFSLESATPSQAEAYGNALLGRLKYPAARVQIGNYTPGARLVCSGWFETLSWKFYSSTDGQEGYDTIGVGLQAFGDDAARVKVAQSCQLAGSVAWTAEKVWVRCKKVGSPADNLTVALFTDSGGAPSASLASGTLAGSVVSQYLNWHEFTLGSKVPLSPSTTYWVVVTRSGAADASNYYDVDGNEALGYSRGSFKIYNGSAWGARSPDADMLFYIYGVRETSSQMSDIITSCGQFFSGSTLDISSGVYSGPYQTGDKNALNILLELFNAGSSNSRRILAEVTKERRLRVYEEAATSGTTDYYIHADGKLYGQLDNVLEPELWRPGVWARLKNVLPTSADISRFTDPTLIFIEETRWQDGSGFLRPREESRLTGISDD